MRERARQDLLKEQGASTARRRFLEICALGGATRFVGTQLGLTVEPNHIRNTWVVLAEGYRLDLWVRPRWHYHYHEAELHDGWLSSHWYRVRKRRVRKVLYRGSTEACLDQANALFTRWDAVTRLGGKPESVGYY